jgi:hypothetical protein
MPGLVFKQMRCWQLFFYWFHNGYKQVDGQYRPLGYGRYKVIPIVVFNAAEN